MRTIAVILLFIILQSCGFREVYADKHTGIAADNVLEIRLRRSDSVYSLTNKSKIKALLAEMNGAQSDGPWKAAAWDEITVVTPDSSLRFRTDGSRFAPGYADWFFRFSSKDVYMNYWGIK